MRALPPKSRENMVFRVDEGMLARFGDRPIHPVLSTWSLVYHLEWVARCLLERCLESGEEGAGAGVDVRHLAPAPLGAEVFVEAELLRQESGRFVCAVRASCDGRPIATGTVYQAVLADDRLSRLWAAGSHRPGSED